MAKKPDDGKRGKNPFLDLIAKLTSGIWKKPQQPDQRDREALTADEERAKAEGLASSEFERFMSGEWVGFTSSNVEAGVYFPESLRLELQFRDGTYYAYFSVGSEEAASLYRAPSKGKWVWDNLRIRGTKLGFRKPYVWLSAPSAKQRMWDESPERAAAHGREAERQTRKALKNNPEALKGAFE